MPSVKLFGIERRHRHEGEHVAVRHVHRDERARLVAHPPRRIFLQALVDGQLDRLAAAVGLGLELLDQLAARGDFDPLAAGRAAKVWFQRLFKALLADLEAGNDQQRILVFRLIFLGVGARRHSRPDGRPPGRPDRSGRSRAVACTPGKLGQADGDRGILLVGDVLGDLHRLEAARLPSAP